MKTLQSVFDTVAIHLLNQGRPAKDGPNCMYRTPDGLKCAIGVLIPDELYRPEFDKGPEGVSLNLDALCRYYRLELKDLFETPPGISPLGYMRFLDRLQIIHDDLYNTTEDGSFDVPDLVAALDDLAHLHNLSIHKIEEWRAQHV